MSSSATVEVDEEIGIGREGVGEASEQDELASWW